VHLTARPPQPHLPSLEQFEWVQTLEDHVRLYADRRMQARLDFLLAPETRCISYAEFIATDRWPAPTDFSTLQTLVGRLTDQGLTVLWADVTAAEVRPFGHVVRAVVPEMVPLSPSHQLRWLGTPRLGRTRDFNPYPHPFA